MKKKKLIVMSFLLIALIALGFIFKWEIYVRYYNLVNNHFEIGEKLYVTDRANFENTSVPVWQVIRPIDHKSQLPTYAVYSTLRIICYKLVENRSAYFGNYFGHKILNVKADNGQIVFSNFYVFKPLVSVIEKGPNYNGYNLPDGYEYSDDKLYAIALDVTNKDLPRFSKK